jgi:SH3 domain protein
MRTGQGTQHKIVKSPKSGVKVEVIEEDKETGYSHVRLESGLEGWVLTRYLIDQPIAKHRLIAANRKLVALRTKVSELKKQLSSTSKTKSGLEKDSNRLSKENNKLNKELSRIKEIASNQIAINNENKKLKEQVLKLKRDMQTVQQENMSLQDRSARDWFLIGAGVCVVGIIMGLVLPNLRFRRKQSWNSL